MGAVRDELPDYLSFVDLQSMMASGLEEMNGYEMRMATAGILQTRSRSSASRTLMIRDMDHRLSRLDTVQIYHSQLTVSPSAMVSYVDLCFGYFAYFFSLSFSSLC